MSNNFIVKEYIENFKSTVLEKYINEDQIIKENSYNKNLIKDLINDIENNYKCNSIRLLSPLNIKNEYIYGFWDFLKISIIDERDIKISFNDILDLIFYNIFNTIYNKDVSIVKNMDSIKNINNKRLNKRLKEYLDKNGKKVVKIINLSKCSYKIIKGYFDRINKLFENNIGWDNNAMNIYFCNIYRKITDPNVSFNFLITKYKEKYYVKSNLFNFINEDELLLLDDLPSYLFFTDKIINDKTKVLYYGIINYKIFGYANFTKYGNIIFEFNNDKDKVIEKKNLTDQLKYIF